MGAIREERERGGEALHGHCSCGPLEGELLRKTCRDGGWGTKRGKRGL